MASIDKPAAFLLGIAFSFAFSACDRKETPRKEDPRKKQTVQPERSAPASLSPGSFGDTHLGFVEWLERDGRFVVYYQFDRDTDEDGDITVSFGDHGEPLGDLPTVYTKMLPAGSTQSWSELIATDPNGRWVVLRDDDELYALSARKRWKVEDADLRPDKSPCNPSRQAAIDPTGTWMSYLRREPHRAVLRNLETGEEREYKAAAELWRAEPTPLGWAVLRESADDTDGDGDVTWPQREGTCVCTWCKRFATSLGEGRRVGDTPRTVLVSPGNKRHEGFTAPLPVAPDTVWSLSRNALFTAANEPRQLGPAKNCRPLAIPLGGRRLVLRCGTDTIVWEPSSGERTPVKETVESLEMYVPPREHHIAVRVTDTDGGRKIGRLNLATGQVEVGPSSVVFGPGHPSGWYLTRDETHLHAFDVSTGSTSSMEVRAGTLGQLVAESEGKWLVVDPTNGKFKKLDARPEFVASNGCYVEPLPAKRPVKGPYQLTCP